ncbi:MAG: site-specific integrase [Rhodocyclaceae bacterium]|nr:site-specific integrase [Rhodocyclaceae bacterium]
MATIEKRTTADGKTTYRAKVRLRGFAPESATFERRADAKAWAAKIETDMREGRHFGKAKRHTFKELADAYEAAETKNLRSFSDRKKHLKYWREAFGADLLSDITVARIKKEKERLLNETTRYTTRVTGDVAIDSRRVMGKRSGPTVNRYLATLSACFRYAVKVEEWMERNPCERVVREDENPGRVRFLSQEELPRLLDACRPNPDLYLAVLLSLTTGGRQSEIMFLRWPQIDFNRRVITLNQGTTKNQDARSLPLVGEAFALMQERAKVRSLKDDRVFPPVSEKAEGRNLRESWERALKAAAITDFRWHDLRHTAASYLAMSGVSLVEIAKILGHRTLAMVARYSHLDPSHVVAVGDKLAARLGVAQ